MCLESGDVIGLSVCVSQPSAQLSRGKYHNKFWMILKVVLQRSYLGCPNGDPNLPIPLKGLHIHHCNFLGVVYKIPSYGLFENSYPFHCTTVGLWVWHDGFVYCFSFFILFMIYIYSISYHIIYYIYINTLFFILPPLLMHWGYVFLALTLRHRL